MREINDNNFNTETKDGVVLVDFWAPWCGPCKMLTPVLEELSKEIEEVNFFKLNVDENSEIAKKFRIASIPTVMVFKNGQIVEQMIGFRPKGAIKDILNKHV